MRFLTIGMTLLVTTAARAEISLLWSNPAGSDIIGPSQTSPLQYTEVADDFDAGAAQLTRVLAYGFGDGCFICPPPNVQGVYVRFYEWTDAGPGVLQAEYFYAASDPNFGYIASDPQTLDITLDPPFHAAGWHFLSVQMAFGLSGGAGGTTWDSGWSFWISHSGAPRTSPVWYRTSEGGPWGPFLNFFSQPVNADVAFALYGDDGEIEPSQDPCGEWEVEPTPRPAPDAEYAPLSDLTVVAADDIWAAGTFNHPVSQWIVRMGYVIHWDGQQWTLVPSPNPQACPECDGPGLTSIEAIAPDDIWAAGNQKYTPPGGFYGVHIFAMHWDGQQWSEVPTPVLGGGSGDSIADIVGFAADNVWFVGGGHPQPAAPHPALAMRWNGSSFELIDVPIVNFDTGRRAGNPLFDADALAPDDMWAVGTTNVNAANAGDLSQIQHWDGSAWTHVPGPTPGYFNQLFAVEMIATDDVWAGGEYWDVNGIFGFLIHWDGQLWTEVAAPGIIKDIVAFAPDNVYAFGGGVFHYDGTEWRTVETFPAVESPVINDAEVVGPCELFAVGRQIEAGGIFDFAARLVPGQGSLMGDTDHDGDVDLADLALLLSAFGSCATDTTYFTGADFDHNSCIELADLAVLLANFGS